MLQKPWTYNDYVHSDVLHFYLLVSLDGNNASTSALDEVKQRFGLHCHLLRLQTSTGGEAPTLQFYTEYYQRNDPARLESLRARIPGWLGDTDLKLIRAFLRDFTSQSLIPHMDRQMQLWNEQVANARRGLTGRIFSVSRKYFGSSASRTSNLHLLTVPSPDDPHTVITLPVYAAQTQEMTMRRLADYSFMLRDYKFALIIYDLVKKDFQGDKAYRYYAGVQQMIGLCSILAEDRKDAESLFDSAVSTFLDQQCLDDAVVTAIKFHNVYVQVQNYREAVRVLLRIVPLVLHLPIFPGNNAHLYRYRM